MMDYLGTPTLPEYGNELGALTNLASKPLLMLHTHSAVLIFKLLLHYDPGALRYKNVLG